MTGTRRSDRRFRAVRERTATLFAALLAVFLQAFVVQTHLHALPVAAINLSIERSVGGDDAQVSAAVEHQRSCLVCQATAGAGAATLPASSHVNADADGVCAVLALALAPSTHSHSWQSRAPPSLL